MLQDISPHKLINAYIDLKPQDGDGIFRFDKEGRVLLGCENGQILFADPSDLKDESAVYLFSIDDKRFFLSLAESEEKKVGFEYYGIREVRDRFSADSGLDVFAVFTAYHLWKWYSENKYCGRCGGKMAYGTKERSLICPECKNTIYPRINPAVIVGVINGDSILLTRYRQGYKHNALVAGFTEVGETLEGTVEREVMEETGLKVKNIRYYKSQPWGMAQDILVGFFCDLDGNPEIHMDRDELKYAEWVKREDIIPQPNNLSLTNEMMMLFKAGKI